MNHHGLTTLPVLTTDTRVALVGSPNSGKTTLFNSLTGLRAKTGNYPGVTVARYQGATTVAERNITVEDLPGVYSLDPISPDEKIVADVLAGRKGLDQPDALIVTADVTTLKRSLGLVAHVAAVGLPTCLVLTFSDELARRGGAIDIAALHRAMGLPVVPIAAGDAAGVKALRELLAAPHSWEQPIIAPPTEPGQLEPWIDSVLAACRYQGATKDRLTTKLDSVALHPLWGSAIFFGLMFGFFQVLFTVAAPLQDGVEAFFAWLGELTAGRVPGIAGAFISEALIGGVGGVLTFLPQIALLFLMISLLEGTGYMARAALLMDNVMGRFGLEGRAFVAMLSALACAIPGIMATRTLPSAKDRIATMMGAPLMTCSARIPVYVMLIAMLVPDRSLGPFGLQGMVLFVLYLLGAISAMLTAALFGKLAGRAQRKLPFYMEIPPYRLPAARTIALSVWGSCTAFLKKVTSVILVTTALVWVALTLPIHSEDQLVRAGVDSADEVAVAQYTIDNSIAAAVGKAVEPVFEPQGFDWRINVGVISSLTAREVFVATMGQIAAAADLEDPQEALLGMTRDQNSSRAGEPLFAPPVVAALLVFFLFALQCFATMGVMRRETGGWKWPAIAFGYMFALAWVFSAAAHAMVKILW